MNLFSVMLGEILAIGSTIAFVTSNTLFRRIDTDISPVQINAFRTIIGSLTYLIIALILWKIPYVKEITALTYLWLILSFIFGQVFGDTAYFKAQKMLGTTIALAISMIFPIFTTVLSIIILKSLPPWYFYLSLGLISLGVIIIAFAKNEQEQLINDRKVETSMNLEASIQTLNSMETVEEKDSKNTIDINRSITKKGIIVGVLIALIAALSWAIGIVLTEKAFTEVAAVLPNDRFTSLIGNLIRFPVAAGILSTMSLTNQKKKIRYWNKTIWLFLILGALIGTSLGAYLYTEAIVYSNAAIVSIIGSSSPLFALPISWIINREKSNWKSIVGIIITTAGVINIFVWQF